MGWDPAKGRLKEKNKEQYALAKARVLALGFQCGAARFKNMAFKLAGVTLKDEESKEVVTDYRATNPLITRRWAEFQTDLVRSRNEDYEVALPSGRVLSYFNVQVYPYLSAEIYKGSRRTGFYGGKILENVVQAIARDVLVDGMCRLDAAGFNVLLHVHDEIVLEVPEDSDPYPEVRELLRIVPGWLKGCPIDVEGGYSPHYLK
jgi:DNA polymerase